MARGRTTEGGLVMATPGGCFQGHTGNHSGTAGMDASEILPIREILGVLRPPPKIRSSMIHYTAQPDPTTILECHNPSIAIPRRSLEFVWTSLPQMRLGRPLSSPRRPTGAPATTPEPPPCPPPKKTPQNTNQMSVGFPPAVACTMCCQVPTALTRFCWMVTEAN